MIQDERALSLLGQTLSGRWELLAVIGTGGAAAVYRAREVTTGKLAAVKVLLADRGRSRDRFVREAKMANKVPSAAVLDVFDGGETDDGRPYLVTKLLEGEDLESARVAAGGALPLPETIAIGIHLLGVLELAHAEGVVHRDVKPANLFRSRQGLVYVLDFGLARALQPEEDSPISSINTPLGTIGFMAPEQAQGRWDLIGPSTDLYAVSATLLKLATGLDVYDSPDPHERFLLSTTRPAPSLVQRRVALPLELCRILDQGLAFAQRDRWASAKEFRDALMGWQEQLHGGPTLVPAPHRSWPAWTRRAVPVALGAVIGVLVAYAWMVLRK